MVKHSFLSFAFLIVASTAIIGQNDTTNIEQPQLDSGTITSQFDYILTKSTAHKEFQLIRKTSLLKVRDHVLDSLKTIRENFALANQSTSKFELKISALEKEVADLKKENQSVSKNMNENINTNNFSNTSLNKTPCNLIVYSIIFVLLLLLIIIVIRFKSYQSKTNKTVEEIADIETEFDSYRKNAMKKEQEIMRKLQNEINKNSK